MKLVVSNNVVVNYVTLLKQIILRSNVPGDVKRTIRHGLDPYSDPTAIQTSIEMYNSTLIREFFDHERQQLVVEIDDGKLIEIVKILAEHQRVAIAILNLIISAVGMYRSVVDLFKQTLEFMIPELETAKYKIYDLLEEPTIWSDPVGEDECPIKDPPFVPDSEDSSSNTA